MLILLALGSILNPKAKAASAGPLVNPYHLIPDRNVFGLRPPVPAASAQAQAPVQKIILTGITTILGDKRALMKTQPPPGRSGEKEHSLILTEGQREAGVEVLAIDVKAGSVTVNNSGTVMTLTFEKNGAKPHPAPPQTPGGRALANSFVRPLATQGNPYSSAFGTVYPGHPPFVRRNLSPPVLSPPAGNLPAGNLRSATPGRAY